MLFHPLAEDVEKYEQKYKELQNVINEYKDTLDIAFEEFLEKVAKMNFEDYIRCIKSSLNASEVFLKRKPNEMRESFCLMGKFPLLGRQILIFRLFLSHMAMHPTLLVI